MTILQELLTWTQGLPTWQSDAVARLLGKQTLTPDDLGDLTALLKIAHGIADPKNRMPKPLTADQIPAQIQNSTHIELKAIKNLKQVNAIAENQTLNFAPSGLTVIYGDNGSGKSGYSRVLKRACRARDQTEVIYPNAYQSADPATQAEATFEIAINGVTQDISWVNNTPSPPELSAFSIFDSRCANSYLANEDDYSYVPLGLDVFERLANTHLQLKSIIEIEQRLHAVDPSAFTHLQSDTVVGKFINALSAKTNSSQIDVLGTLSPEELIQHLDLENNLKENNPKDKATQLRLLALRIRTVATNATNKLELINQEVVTKLQDMSDKYHIAKAAAGLAANRFKEQEDLLPGTGGVAWRELFEAARRFSTESKPEKTFPELGTGSACPLCQQPLNEGAKRLVRFESYIQQEAERTLQARRAELNTLYSTFIKYELKLGLDEVTCSEISLLDPQLVSSILTFEQALIDRQEHIKKAISDNKWTPLPLIANPTSQLQALVEQLNTQAAQLDQASDEQARAQLQQQFNELDARVKLSQVKDAVTNAVSRLQHQAKLTKCLSALKTNAISIKSSELVESVVSKDLMNALNNEFKALGVGGLQVSLQSRAGKGKVLHKLKLELPLNRNPSDILSEGEQRAIALASFLAEAGLSDGRSGVIFDDPVSSLDHRRRELVAKRLVAEAKHRQVIVFTHDIYFLCVLEEAAEATGTPISTQSISKRPEGFGVSSPDLPFEGRNTVRRSGALKAQQQHIDKLHRNGDEEAHRKETVDAYFNMRMTWERAIEEVLLRRVVLRFRKGIETQRLSEVSVTDDDYAIVTSGMTKCSNYAHDKAMAGGVAVPEPDELLADIVALETWRTNIEKRSIITKNSRKS